jgi:putative Holliday junction resolvase
VRILGVDVGARRIGLAITDPTRTLARPLATLQTTRDDGPALVAREVARLIAEDGGLILIVVGLPMHLDGTPSEQTARVRAFIDALRARTSLPIVEQDERLSSREAESLLAHRERDWQKRKQKLDKTAAAVVLQDYLESGRFKVGSAAADATETLVDVEDDGSGRVR